MSNVSLLMKPILVAMLLAVASLAIAQDKPHSFAPKAGFVPNEATAIKIAEAVWLPIYGTKIYDKKPFVAKAKGDVWLVEGSLQEGTLGGVPLAEISRLDGRVIRVSHGQ